MNSNQRIQIHALRHPRIENDAREHLLGHSDVPLSEKGVSEARELARGVASRFEAESVGVIHTSDLSRCSTLAAFIAEEMGCEHRSDERLRAQHLGDWTGKSGEELKRGPREDLEGFHLNTATWCPPGGGESLIDVAKRCFSWYAEAVSECEGKDLVVVTHSSVLRVLIAKVIGLPFDNCIRLAPAMGTYTCLEADRHGNGTLLSLGGSLG